MKTQRIIAAELAGFNKSREIKVVGALLEGIEIIAFMTDVDYLAFRRLFLKLLGERQQRGYVPAGAAPRQYDCWRKLFHQAPY